MKIYKIKGICRSSDRNFNSRVAVKTYEDVLILALGSLEFLRNVSITEVESGKMVFYHF